MSVCLSLSHKLKLTYAQITPLFERNINYIVFF